MNRITATLLCLVLCLGGTMVPTDAKVSAADTVANMVIAMTIGSKIIKVDDVDGEIDAGPQIKWGHTFSPIAPIINALGGATQSVDNGRDGGKRMAPLNLGACVDFAVYVVDLDDLRTDGHGYDHIGNGVSGGDFGIS